MCEITLNLAVIAIMFIVGGVVGTFITIGYILMSKDNEQKMEK